MNNERSERERGGDRVVRSEYPQDEKVIKKTRIKSIENTPNYRFIV